MDEVFAFVTITNLDNTYELVASIDENQDYNGLAIVIKGDKPEVWDNEDWVLNKLFPICNYVCNGVLSYEDGAVKLGYGWGPVTEDDVCTLYDLFESAKRLGVIEEITIGGNEFSDN